MESEKRLKSSNRYSALMNANRFFIRVHPCPLAALSRRRSGSVVELHRSA
jgi:hypothetical protein